MKRSRKNLTSTGQRLIKIRRTQMSVINIQMVRAFFSSLKMLVTATRNMRPPSTGPIGRRLKRPTPRLIVNIQKRSRMNQR